jgi:translation initiation factor 2 gamma subunit (eIF-2gamma)
MPPEVEPEQPQTKEHSISMPILNVGQRLVSVVANPVDVLSEQTWKAANRNALGKEV